MSSLKSLWFLFGYISNLPLTVVFGLNAVITVSRRSVWSFSVFTLLGKCDLVTVTLLMPCLLILTSMAARFVISFYKPMRHANFWLWTNYSLATVMRRGSLDARGCHMPQQFLSFVPEKNVKLPGNNLNLSSLALKFVSISSNTALGQG